jgi:hypothetical protein
MPRLGSSVTLPCVLALIGFAVTATAAAADDKPAAKDPAHAQHHAVEFSIRSTRSGRWSDPAVWAPARVPAAGDRVLISRDTSVLYDAASDDVIRLLQIVGTLRFARDRDTLLNVGILKVQNSDECSEHGFACDFEGATRTGEPTAAPAGKLPLLEVGTLLDPIPAEHTARIRLHYLEGMDRDDAPALVCCSARMELHGARLSRTWVELGADVARSDSSLTLSEPVTGWRVGDAVIVTGSERKDRGRSARGNSKAVTTEERRITRIEGDTLHLDRPLDHPHAGSGDFRSEVANLSRNVIVESADPDGVRGHTLYHAFSQGGLSYARFAHLGKEGVLGRYSIHFHLLGDSMRGSQVLGVAVVDSHNRWVTVHGTEYLVVRDCVGYQSVGHGFFLEDGTEVDNLLDRNLGVQAYHGKRLKDQALPFDPNDGAAFWWANGRNTLVRNVACENDEYGFRYDMRHSQYFSSTLPVSLPDGSTRPIDVRTIPIWRFEDNESHSEGLYGLVVAANGEHQPDSPIDDQQMLDHIRRLDWTGPDARHPHVIRNMTIWESHYAFRPHSPCMLMENVRIDRAAYGIYRPAFDNQVYLNLHFSNIGPEPFNRGMDDASAQTGTITVDGLTIDDLRGGDQRHPYVHMTDNALSDNAACHFRNLRLPTSDLRPPTSDRRRTRPLFNRGGSVRADPFVPRGVPYFLHDYYAPGRHARLVSSKAADLLADGRTYRSDPPLTGDESVVTEVRDLEWPELLHPVDDLPPATIITLIEPAGERLIVHGISHDNGDITAVTVNGKPAELLSNTAGVVDWRITIPVTEDGLVQAHAADAAGNVEQRVHKVRAVEDVLTGFTP